MKKISMILFACLMACFCLAGCGGKKTTYTAGTYTGEAQGFGGTVEVTLTVTETDITDVVITGKDETPAIGGAALETLAESIKNANGAEFDLISGATYTSNGVKEAFENALNAAKGK